jgi:hypothetical protein
MSSKLSAAAAIAAILIVATAFSPSANAQSSSDACSLLTQAQVKSALTVPVNAGTSTPDKKVCTWNVSTPTAKGVKFVTLFLEDVSVYQSAKQASPGRVITPVSSVGDDAFYSTMGTFVLLHFKKGSVAFRVSLYAGTDIPMEKKQDMEKTLALQIASEL